jgi:hypothetical protein
MVRTEGAREGDLGGRGGGVLVDIVDSDLDATKEGLYVGMCGQSILALVQERMCRLLF